MMIWTLARTRLVEVAPGMFVPSNAHMQVKVLLDCAPTVMVTFVPLGTVWLCGCRVMIGAAVKPALPYTTIPVWIGT